MTTHAMTWDEVVAVLRKCGAVGVTTGTDYTSVYTVTQARDSRNGKHAIIELSQYKHVPIKATITMDKVVTIVAEDKHTPTHVEIKFTLKDDSMIAFTPLQLTPSYTTLCQ